MLFLTALALQAAQPLPDPGVSCIADALPSAELQAALGLKASGRRGPPMPAAARKLRIATSHCQDFYSWIDHSRLRATYYMISRATLDWVQGILASRDIQTTAIDDVFTALTPGEQRGLFIAVNGSVRGYESLIARLANLSSARAGSVYVVKEGEPTNAALIGIGVGAMVGVNLTQRMDIGPILAAAERADRGAPAPM